MSEIGGQRDEQIKTILWSNDTKVEDYGNKCRKCSMEHQRGSHVVNTKVSSSQNVKMRQGHELLGNHLSHGLYFKFRIQVYFHSTAHGCKSVPEH